MPLFSVEICKVQIQRESLSSVSWWAAWPGQVPWRPYIHSEELRHHPATQTRPDSAQPNFWLSEWRLGLPGPKRGVWHGKSAPPEERNVDSKSQCHHWFSAYLENSSCLASPVFTALKWGEGETAWSQRSHADLRVWFLLPQISKKKNPYAHQDSEAKGH